MPVGERFSAPVQIGPEAHPASCTMGTGSFPGVKCGRGVTLNPHPLIVPWSKKSRAIPLPPLGHNRACNGVTLPYMLLKKYFTTFLSHFVLYSLIQFPFLIVTAGGMAGSPNPFASTRP